MCWYSTHSVKISRNVFIRLMKAEEFISTRIFQYYRFITLDTWLGLFDIFMLELQGRLGLKLSGKNSLIKRTAVFPPNQNPFGPILWYGRPSIPQVRTTLAEFGSLFFLLTRHLNFFLVMIVCLASQRITQSITVRSPKPATVIADARR